MNSEIDGKVALVTGAAAGIGRATAQRFAADGVKVVVADVATDEGQQTTRLIEQSGGTAHFVRCDVSSATDVEAMVEEVLTRYGRLDAAFNNAGVECEMATIGEAKEEDWDRVMSINLKGIWLCMKYEIAAMMRQGGGAIVNSSSVVGALGQPNMASYVASKHGVLGLTKTAALEYASSSIRVNAVCPAIVDTPMLHRYTKGDTELAAELTAQYPTQRITQPEEVANAVLWLCSDAASYVNGHSLMIDGGLSIQ